MGRVALFPLFCVFPRAPRDVPPKMPPNPPRPPNCAKLFGTSITIIKPTVPTKTRALFNHDLHPSDVTGSIGCEP